MMNLTTTYLGMTLKHPIVASASPLSHTLDGIKALEEAGAAAVVMYSLFEEQMSQRHKIAEKYVAHPEREDYLEVRGCVCGANSRSQSGGQHSHHRQLECDFGGRLD